ncbi:hypothetical protein ACHAWC_011487 [Mediolabrus comicus]
MDITIPPHNLKRFTAAITCLGKIGKDLYLSFDPLDGLILSSLNEAKSAFGKFHFDPTFFDRCSAPPVVSPTAAAASSSSRRRGNNDGDSDDEDDDEFYDSSRYVCRVPVRSVHAILRPRKGVCSLRIRSEGMDDEGNHFGLNRKRKRRRNNQKQQHRGGDGDNDNENDNDEREQQRPYSVRRNRKKRKSNKRSNNNNDNGDTDNTDGLANNNDKMMLSFEFIIEHITKNNQNGCNGSSGDGTFRVIHKVGVTDANGITLSASTRKRDRSEIVSPPKLWLRLLDPLRRTAEVALTIDDELKVVTATSFHPGEIQQHQQQQNSTEDNAVLQAAAAKAAVLKTETSTGTEEFDEYDFRNNRGRKKNRKKKNRRNGGGRDGENDDDDDDTDDENEEDEERESEIPPPDVNQKVILVFSIKEAKAMLQYCAQTNSTFHDDGDALSIISFHWGGKPIVIETDGDSFSGELVLATLHHGMITSNITVGSNRRESSG